jgi:hypothetical protein
MQAPQHLSSRLVQEGKNMIYDENGNERRTDTLPYSSSLGHPGPQRGQARRSSAADRASSISRNPLGPWVTEGGSQWGL